MRVEIKLETAVTGFLPQLLGRLLLELAVVAARPVAQVRLTVAWAAPAVVALVPLEMARRQLAGPKILGLVVAVLIRAKLDRVARVLLLFVTPSSIL
jgi:hypothetical protein